MEEWDPRTLGRVGGFIAIVMGALIFISGIVIVKTSWDLGLTSDGEPGLTLPVIAFAIGPLICAYGVFGILIAPKKFKPLIPVEQALQIVGKHPTPFFVCTRCRLVTTENMLGRCVRCGRAVDCLDVFDEDDRHIAITALGGQYSPRASAN